MPEHCGMVPDARQWARCRCADSSSSQSPSIRYKLRAPAPIDSSSCRLSLAWCTSPAQTTLTKPSPQSSPLTTVLVLDRRYPIPLRLPWLCHMLAIRKGSLRGARNQNMQSCVFNSWYGRSFSLPRIQYWSCSLVGHLWLMGDQSNCSDIRHDIRLVQNTHRHMSRHNSCPLGGDVSLTENWMLSHHMLFLQVWYYAHRVEIYAKKTDKRIPWCHNFIPKPVLQGWSHSSEEHAFQRNKLNSLSFQTASGFSSSPNKLSNLPWSRSHDASIHCQDAASRTNRWTATLDVFGWWSGLKIHFRLHISVWSSQNMNHSPMGLHAECSCTILMYT